MILFVSGAVARGSLPEAELAIRVWRFVLFPYSVVRTLTTSEKKVIVLSILRW